jgi:hypothetical protein
MVIYCRIKVSTLGMLEKGIEGVLLHYWWKFFYYFEKKLVFKIN